MALKQRTRLTLLVIEILILCAASYLALGVPLPPGSDAGFWFYVALLGLIFGARLDTPHFTKPADAILYSSGAAIALALSSHLDQWNQAEVVAFSIAIGYACLVGLVAAFAIYTLREDDTESAASNAARTIVETLGNPRAIFSIVIVFALFVFHRNSAKEVGIIAAAWALTGGLAPLEKLIELTARVKRAISKKTATASDGLVAAFQVPGLVLVRRQGARSLSFGDVLLVNDPLGKAQLCLALDDIGRDEGLLLRLLAIEGLEANRLSGASSKLEAGQVCRVEESSIDEGLREQLAPYASLVGLVAPETSIDRLYFEVVRDEGLAEARIVEARVGRDLVAYQIVNGLTKEEVVLQKNTFGFARAQAQKVGRWCSESQKFVRSPWLPRPNAPVFLRESELFEARRDAVGSFPGTAYPATIKSIHELVTHNTAILGILGVGKSMLAIELVERMIGAGIKVVCLDLTDQYAHELADFYDASGEQMALEKIQTAGDQDRDAFAENPEDGGSLPNLRAAIRGDLKTFLSEGNDARLKIYNPSRVTGTKQVSEPKTFQSQGQWRRGAALWSVTPVEVARIVTESVLEILQDRMSADARACVVFEEAHSLIPEFTSVAASTDREATNGTARAILQGRKYGLGCLVVTQRTANVTKTILNQCNTVFAMRTFDTTGKDFLANYVGADYAGMLSSLEERHAVFFGKASSCENPILIRLNDKDDFRRVFRAGNIGNMGQSSLSNAS